MYRLCSKRSCLRCVWSLVPQNNRFTEFFPSSACITYTFHMKQMWPIEPKSHGFLQTFSDHKKSNVCGVRDKWRNLTWGVLPMCCKTPWDRVDAGACRLQVGECQGSSCRTGKDGVPPSLSPKYPLNTSAMVNALGSGPFFWPVWVNFPWNQSFITMQTIWNIWLKR